MRSCHANDAVLFWGQRKLSVPAAAMVLVLLCGCGGLTGCKNTDTPPTPDTGTPVSANTVVPATPDEKPDAQVDLPETFRRAEDAPLATEEEIANAVESPEAFLTTEQLVLYNKATDAATLFFQDPPISFPHYFGKDAWCWDCIPSPAPGEATYYRSTMTWQTFQEEVLKVFMPEYFTWANDALYKPDENGALLCADISSGYNGEWETVGYTLLSSEENMVRFLEIVTFRDDFPPESGPAETTRAVPVILVRTEAGWRVGEIHLA